MCTLSQQVKWVYGHTSKMAADQENNFCFASNEVYLYVVFLFIWIINKTWVHALK